ncbi:MAG: hypothetical protein PVJ57_01895 [Phycisphaerae bacterium]|jgi:hypothetical protein
MSYLLTDSGLPTRRGAAVRYVPHCLAALLCLCAATSFAADEVSRQDRALLERLALAHARADLVAQVYALPINDSLTVGAWAARHLPRDRGLRLWLRSLPDSGPARVYGDATCDADIRLDPEALRAELDKWLAQDVDTGSPAIGPGDIRRAAARWPILWGSGTATMPAATRTRRPEGWEDVTPEGIEAAQRAAEADARYALLEQAGELPVTNARRLREFLASDDAVRTAVLAGLERQAEVSTTFALDQVAVARARVSLITLIRILTDVHQQHYRGDLFHAADFREMALLTTQEEITAVGLAVPPRQAIPRARYEAIELDAPSWAKETLTAVGRYQPDDEEQPAPPDAAAVARLDGIDRLRQQVEQLVIQQNVTVEQFLGRHEELKDDVVRFLSGARVTAPARTLDGDVVEVSVSLPLRRLWWIVRRGMRTVEVDVPASAIPATRENP